MIYITLCMYILVSSGSFMAHTVDDDISILESIFLALTWPITLGIVIAELEKQGEE